MTRASLVPSSASPVNSPSAQSGFEFARLSSVAGPRAEAPAPQGVNARAPAYGARYGADTLLGFQAGGHYWLCEAPGVLVLTVPPISPVPLTRPWFRGLAAIQGALLGVVDLSAFVGGTLTPITQDSRVLRLIDPSGEDAVLLVGAIVGERRVDELTPDPEAHAESTWDLPSLRDSRGRVWHLLNFPAVFALREFRDICP